ncbi:MAG: glutamyl-tRNA reductase, partial [Ardenticatenaceae bacterium]
MHILLTGLNHRGAPLEARERISFSKEQLPEALAQLKERMGEALILSTCNRTEVYSATENPEKAARQIRQFVAEFHGLDAEAVSPYLYDYTDSRAVHHLFRVSSGLDSMIVGESQILGQVRDALRAASESQSVGVSLVGFFHAAVRVGRRVREETGVGRNALSISYAGVQLAQRILKDLRGLQVLLVGAGEAGRLVANALRTVGVGDLVIANRTLSRAEELARELGGRAIPFADLSEMLTTSDIMIAATDSPEYVLTHDLVASAIAARSKRPLFLFDLAVPRDIDPQVASLDGVELFNIDDLSAVAEDNLEERRRAAIFAEQIVAEELEQFMVWWESLDTAPIVKTLRLQAEEVRQRELARAFGMMPDLSDEQQKIVEALTRSIVNKLLHDP